MERLGAVSVRLLRATDAPIDSTMHHFPAAHIGMLSQSESGLSHSRPLRLTPNENRPGLGKRTEDLCPLTYSKNFSQPAEL